MAELSQFITEHPYWTVFFSVLLYGILARGVS